MRPWVRAKAPSLWLPAGAPNNGGKPVSESNPLDRFVVILTNEILGNSRQEMTLDQIKKFNLCAYRLAVKSAKNDGREYSDGMWTIRVA
jgi:hypothetical protein